MNYSVLSRACCAIVVGVLLGATQTVQAVPWRAIGNSLSLFDTQINVRPNPLGGGWDGSLVSPYNNRRFDFGPLEPAELLRAMGLRRLRWGRHWVVSGFLVPGLNLVRPYQVMREVWQGSHPDNLDPFNWRAVPVPPLLVAQVYARLGVTFEELSTLVDRPGATEGSS